MPLAAPDLAQDPGLEQLLLGGIAGDLVDEVARDHDHAVPVADHDVAGVDRHAAAADRHVGIDRGVAMKARRRRWRADIDRHGELGDVGDVAHAAVGHHAADAALGQAGHQDVAARGGADIAPAVGHQHGAGRALLDRAPLRMVIAVLARAVQVLARRDVAQGVGLADHDRAGIVVEPRDAQQEGVAQAPLEQLGRERRGAGLGQKPPRLVRQSAHPFPPRPGALLRPASNHAASRLASSAGSFGRGAARGHDRCPPRGGWAKQGAGT